MTSRLSLEASCAIAATAAALSGCAHQPPQPAPPAPVQPALSVQQQVRPDGTTFFVSCAECTRPTPKTLRQPGAQVKPSAERSTSTSPSPAATRSAEERGNTAKPAPAVAPPSTTILITARLYFDTSRSAPNRASLQRLSRLQPLLKQATSVVVHGYTDRSGPAAANLRLADARARDAAARIAAASGIQGGAVTASAAEQDCCTAHGAQDSKQRAAARRVEIHFAVPAGPAQRALLAQLRADLQSAEATGLASRTIP
ncbi:MAG: OmpA family protein [Rubrivivax sp.]